MLDIARWGGVMVHMQMPLDTVDAGSGAVRTFTAARTARRKNTVKHTEAVKRFKQPEGKRMGFAFTRHSFGILPTRDMLHDVYVSWSGLGRFKHTINDALTCCNVQIPYVDMFHDMFVH